MEQFLTILIVDFLLLSAAGQPYNDDVITELVYRLDAQQRQIESYIQQNEAQQRQIDALQETVTKQQTEIQRLTEEQDYVKTSLQPNTQRFEEQQDDNVPNERSKRQLPVEGTVAFTAVLTHQLSNMGIDQNVIFDRIYTNVGGGYNEHHGVFIAPVPGIYVFFVNVFTQPNKLAFCRIAVNGVNKADVYVEGKTAHNAGSQMVVVQLSKGDDVAVQNKYQTDIIWSDANIYTTFSGFLLQSLIDFNGGIVGK